MKNLKLLLAVVCMAAVSTSCLKTDDSYGLTSHSGYLMQTFRFTGSDTIPQFQPYYIFTTNQSTASAVLSKGIDTYPMSSVNSSTWVTNNDSYMMVSEDSIPSSYFSLVVKNADGEVATNQFRFYADSTKVLGYVKLNSINYDANSGVVTFKYNKVKNATQYYAVVKYSDSPYRLPTLLNTSVSGDEYTGTFTMYGIATGNTLKIALSATSSGYVFCDSQWNTVTTGTNYSKTY